MSIKLMSDVWDSDYAKQSHARLLVMLKLADHANDDGECYPSQKTIAKKCGLARPTVNGIIKDLEQDGKLTITHTQAQNRYNLDFQSLDSSVTSDDSGKFPVSPQVTPGVSVDDSGCQRRLHKSSDNHQEPSDVGASAELTVELDEDIPKKKKPRLKNPSSPRLKQPRDPRLDRPIIQVVKGLMRRFPDKLLWDKLITRFGDDFDSDKLRECREAWIGRGYNPNATTWLNWYFEGIPQYGNNGTNKPQSFQDRRAEIARESYKRESEIRQRVRERDQELSGQAISSDSRLLSPIEPNTD